MTSPKFFPFLFRKSTVQSHHLYCTFPVPQLNDVSIVMIGQKTMDRPEVIHQAMRRTILSHPCYVLFAFYWSPYTSTTVCIMCNSRTKLAALQYPTASFYFFLNNCNHLRHVSLLPSGIPSIPINPREIISKISLHH